MYESWFCTTPDMIGLAGSIRFISLSSGLPMYSFMNSGSGSRTRLDRVRGEEAVLHVEERRLAGLGGAAGDEAEVAGFLGVAGEQHAPAASATLMTSSCPAWTLSPWLVSARAPMLNTTGSRLPEIV